jgi:DNA-binding MarR family transcriptional regulator
VVNGIRGSRLTVPKSDCAAAGLSPIMLSSLIITVYNDYSEKRMARRRGSGGDLVASDNLGFLLSQVGAHAAARFAEWLAPLDIAPAHAGILRVLRQADGVSQQALGEKLGVFTSRLVGLLDELEARELVERRQNPTDRRSYALYLTEKGRETVQKIDRVSNKQQDTLCAGLTQTERTQLAKLLRQIADEQGLRPGIHPGYRSHT